MITAQQVQSTFEQDEDVTVYLAEYLLWGGEVIANCHLYIGPYGEVDAVVIETAIGSGFTVHKMDVNIEQQCKMPMLQRPTIAYNWFANKLNERARSHNEDEPDSEIELYKVHNVEL